MLRRIARISAPLTLIASVTLTWLFAGCGTDVTIAENYDAAPPALVSPDAEPVLPRAGLTEYCPSSQCPAGHTTCPGSRFRCEVDLRTDENNCGVCGNVCPARGIDETYACVDGRCVMECDVGQKAMDCDGFPDNGCETHPNDDNCGACGKKCLNPAKPCAVTGDADWGCGCHGAELPCMQGPIRRCTDVRADDGNCGACGNVCDPSGGGAPVYENTYYGCVKGTCGYPKCLLGYANCDGDITNGCETPLLDDANCGTCGNACPANTKCLLDSQQRPMCACPGDRAYCQTMCFGSVCLGECSDLTWDADNCGGCGVKCSLQGHADPICSFGTCSYRCKEGWADCNGDPGDGCEVNIYSDPRNCGDCGIACDAVAGQACVAGQCVVEPCDSIQDGGVPAR